MTVSRLAAACPQNPLQLNDAELASADRLAQPMGAVMGCCRSLQMGFFFDGTRNNLYYDEPKQTHSNVARLSGISLGMSDTLTRRFNA